MSATPASSRLGPGAKIILAVNALFILGINFSNAFVNVYLWKLNDSLAAIAWYYVYQYVGLAVGFVVGGKLAEKQDRIATLRVGVVLHAAFFAAVLFLQGDAGRYIPRLGILLGLGSGFYWLGTNVLAFDLTNDENVDYFNGLFSLFGSLGAMVAPFTAGWIIISSNRFAGYTFIFTVSLALFVATTGASLLLRRRASDGQFTLEPAIVPDYPGSEWPALLLVQLFNGFRNGVFAFLIGILVYFATGSEFGVGVFSLLTGSVTLGGSYIVGRFIGRSLRKTSIFWGQMASTAAVVVLAFWPNLVGLGVFGLLEALAVPVYGIPFGALNFAIIDRDPAVADRRVEYMVARELPLNAGRLLGLALFILLAPGLLESREKMTALLLVYGVIPAIGWLYIRRMETSSESDSYV